jgi:PilZ domain
MYDAQRDLRRHPRFPLGLPVKVTLAGRAEPLLAELVDVSEAGGCFRVVGEGIHLDDHAAFGFVLPGARHCKASGRCVRVRGTGEFALLLDCVNDAFLGFVKLLSAPSTAA